MPVDPSAIEKGYLVKPEEEANESKRLVLHFNPASLTQSIEASAPQQNQPNRTGQVQFAAQYSAKLSFDAIFDNSDNGEDIRLTTSRISAFLEPAPAAQGGSENSGTNAPPLLLFHWGSFRFTGVLTQFRETIEFFAKEGVPLRASVGLTLVKQDKRLEGGNRPQGPGGGGAVVSTRAGDSALSAATRGGDPRAARDLASANGLANLRFTAGATLRVDEGVRGRASAGFAAGARGAVDAAGTWNVSGSGSLFGGKSSAGLSASAGAFAGIGRGGASAGVTLDPSRMLAGGSTADLSAHAGSSFSLGGSAQMQVGAGLSANVGAKVSWKDLVQFDDEG